MHYIVREDIIILVIILSGTHYCSAKHKSPGITSYLFSPQTAWFQISIYRAT